MTASNNGQQLNSLSVTIDVIQYSHDMLNAILHDDLPIPIEEIMELDEEIQAEMAASLSVLCWLLGHDNPTFMDNITRLEQALDEAGIEFGLNPDN